MMQYLAIFHVLFLLHNCCNIFIHASSNSAGRCQCGRFARNTSATTTVAGKLYDTVVPLNSDDSSYESSIFHAYSPSMGRCVAIKHCSEHTARLNKCTRELEVLKAFNGSSSSTAKTTTNNHLIKYFDSEIKYGQNCQERGLWADYLRMIVIGSDRRMRRRRSETEKNNCTDVAMVLELGLNSLSSFCKKCGCDAQTLGEAQRQLQLALDELHGKGVAHRDVHPENALIFPSTSSSLPFATTEANKNDSKNLFVKLIDFGWSCCFDAAKCGPRLARELPKCEEDEAVADDQFGLNDIQSELLRGKG